MPTPKYWGNVNKVRGVETIRKNLRTKSRDMRMGFERGAKLAGAYLLGKSQKLVPVEYGNLKASGYVRATGKGLATRVNIGYTAFYAMYVHENIEMVLKGKPRPSGIGVYWGPTGQAKFIEYPARTEAATMREIIKASIKASIK